MEDSKTLLCSLKFQWVSERAPSKFVDSLGTCPQKVRQACSIYPIYYNFCRHYCY